MSYMNKQLKQSFAILLLRYIIYGTLPFAEQDGAPPFGRWHFSNRKPWI